MKNVTGRIIVENVAWFFMALLVMLMLNSMMGCSTMRGMMQGAGRAVAQGPKQKQMTCQKMINDPNYQSYDCQ